MTMLKNLKYKYIRNQTLFWYWLVFVAILVIGCLVTLYVAIAQDTEMRNDLSTYAATIEQSINWQEHAAKLNTKPEALKESDFSELYRQLNGACKVNKNCHFIYLLYADSSANQPNVKFLLDASPQPSSEISHLGDVFAEASNPLKQAMQHKTKLVDGPVTDRWGTWVSAFVPIGVTRNTPQFIMLGIDVVAADWKSRIFKKMLLPIISMLVFLGILLRLIFHNIKREKLVTQLSNSTSILAEIANNDALTGLPNRRLLEDRMSQALKSAQRAESIAAVLFLDLDLFKSVNDTHGHVVGDQVLKMVAQRLTNLLRAEDTVARIGGDEFVVLLQNLTDEQQVKITADKILNVLAAPYVLDKQKILLGASVGIAMFPPHGAEPNDLISHADIAMYAAKRQGRNCYAIYQAD